MWRESWLVLGGECDSIVKQIARESGMDESIYEMQRQVGGVAAKGRYGDIEYGREGST